MAELAPPSLLTKAEGRGPSDHLRDVLEALPVSLMRLDQDGVLLAVNHAGLALLGASALEDVLGTSFLRFVPERAHECTQLLAAASQGQSGSLTLDLVGLTGTPHALELHAVPHPGAPDGTRTAMVTVRDVSYVRQLAHSLVEATAEQAAQATSAEADRAAQDEAADEIARLSARVGELTAALTAAGERARIADARYDNETATLRETRDAANGERLEALQSLAAAGEQIAALTSQVADLERTLGDERAAQEAHANLLLARLAREEHEHTVRVQEIEAAHARDHDSMIAAHAERVAAIEKASADGLEQAAGDWAGRFERLESETAARFANMQTEHALRLNEMESMQQTRVAALETEWTARVADAARTRDEAIAQVNAAETALSQAESRFCDEQRRLEDALGTAESTAREALENAAAERRHRAAADRVRQQVVEAAARLARDVGLLESAASTTRDASADPDAGAASVW